MDYVRHDFKTGEVLTADSLNHLEDGIALAMKAGGGVTKTTYAELKALRDAGQLKPGAFYRITDYVTTTIQANTRSAGHQFDLIVLALDEKTLCEEAKATLHDGDTYFSEAGANLAKWKISYCLDNDATRFAWADEINGKGVIYKLIDDYANACPYDHKNIITLIVPTFDCTLYGAPHTYTQNGQIVTINGVNYYGYLRTKTTSGPPPPPLNLYSTEEVPSTSMTLYTISDSVAELYTQATITSVTDESGEFYTFHCVNEDASLKRTYNCFNNTIREYIESGIQRINFIKLVSADASRFDCVGNYISENCQYINIGQNSVFNKIGVNCANVELGIDCDNNRVGNDCDEVKFQTGNNNNKLGPNCSKTTFGENCWDNILESGCTNIVFATTCRSNYLGPFCSNINFALNSFSNHLSANCGNIDISSSYIWAGPNSERALVQKNIFDE